MSDEVPTAVLDAWGLGDAHLEPITIGLINRTLRAHRADGTALILQRLHPAFGGAVNADIDAVTAHLASRGLATPRVVPTRSGALWLEHEGVWRALTHLAGMVHTTVAHPGVAREAASLAARFHRATADLAHTFAFTRPGAHDTDRHLERLATALGARGEDPACEGAAPIARAILAHPRPVVPATRTRVIHGDLKITNVLFDETGLRAHALLDLDTLGHGTIPVELGDALRSWCNPAGESADGAVDEAIFRAAVEGYAETSAGLLDRDEIAALVPGFETIALELASRFAVDAFEDSYFGWDRARFPSRRAHNLVRARSQLGLARDVLARRDALGAIAARAFAT